jgi:transcriptional antiterminator NusG
MDWSSPSDQYPVRASNQGQKGIYMGAAVRELSPPERANLLPWFAVVIKPQHERAVQEGLQQKGLESFLPMYRATRRWSDRLKHLQLPLFPGYVFCRFETNGKVPVLRTPGVRSIVSCGTKILAVPEEEIDRVRLIASSGSAMEPWPFLKTGQRVRVCDGPLLGLEGIVAQVRNTTRVVVGMELLQRSVAVQLNRDQIEPVRSALHSAQALSPRG